MKDFDIQLEKEKIYYKTSERTFQKDNYLPNLPIPNLQQTLRKYLYSVKPHVSEEEYNKTEKIVQEFQSGIGEVLHFKLLQRSRHCRNWLEKWWESLYLRTRTPIIPFINISGCNYMSPSSGEDIIDGTAILIHYYLQYWKFLRKETLPTQKNKDDHFCMNQWKRLFSCCRIPGLTEDHFVEFFNTELENKKSPVHVSVLHHGYAFIFNAVDTDGQLLTPNELCQQLSYVIDYCKQLPYGPSLGALTCDERTSWFKNRKYLISLHPENEHYLHLIESSLFTIILDENSPHSDNEVFLESIGGDIRNRWADKSLQLISFTNGKVSTNGDHAPLDAMVLLSLNHWAFLGLLENNCQLPDTMRIKNLPKPKVLKFKIDDNIAQKVEVAQNLALNNISNVEVTRRCFYVFGKDFITRQHRHPDTFIQLSLQLAYYRLHHRPAPTYETASTRRFYHGRTETVRSCTIEAVQWAKSMLNSSESVQTKLRLMDEAFRKHNTLMDEAMKNEGCDRHLLGLFLTAQEEGIPIPEIFLDPSYTKSGGNNNFKLSTSLCGYTAMHGGVAAMCEDGYGVFYAIQKQQIIFVVTAWKSCQETNTMNFYKTISKSLTDMQKLLITPNL